MRAKGESPTTYADAGVDRKAAARVVERIRDAVRSTYREEVVGDIGHFGGLFALDIARYRHPLLVSATDGAGTKVMIAEEMGVFDTIGIDLVAMSVNDVAALGAEPLFFLDYIVTGKTDESVVAEIVKGIAEACRQVACALIGGEVAEHPGHLAPGAFDLAGFCVGIVERDDLVDGSRIEASDVVIGIESSGIHSNGLSLARRVLLENMGLRLDDRPMELGGTLGEELLRPTALYPPVVSRLRTEATVRGLAHVTQGGIGENLERILPEGLAAEIQSSAWEVPPIFELIRSLGSVPDEEMRSTFNLGIGMVAVVPSAQANAALDAIRESGHHAHEIGVVAPQASGGPRVWLQ